MNFYDYSAVSMQGKEIKMEEYKGRVVVIVNTASKCGFTPQLKGLEAMYEKYKDKGLVILGFPCNQFAKQDPKSNKEISEFCLRNYGVTFQMFEKIEVNGNNAHPLYKFLKNEKRGVCTKSIKWNFSKFVIDREGNVVKRFSPLKNPLKMEKVINKYLGA